MTNAVELTAVTKRYWPAVALEAVTVAVPRRSITGLIGRNGSGKSTLLRVAAGLVVADEGECTTLGRPAARLGAAELARIGIVHQHDTLIEWMTAGQLLRYVGSFYAAWDRGLEHALLSALEVDVSARVGALSPGNRQKLALILATCHHPELLLLDEPLSDLDPIARSAVLTLLLERFSSDEVTIVISSHMLRDIEPVVNRIVCLEAGRVAADAEFDELTERYTEWIVTSPLGRLPERFTQPYVLSASGDGYRARLAVRDAAGEEAPFMAAYDATIERRPLNLERLFPLLTLPAGGGSASGTPGGAAPVGAGEHTGGAR